MIEAWHRPNHDVKCTPKRSDRDTAAEAWVHEKALAALDGKASIVAAAIRRTANCSALEDAERANAARAADDLLNQAAHLDYPTALAKGWPMATGVIEGGPAATCERRHGHHRRTLGAGGRRGCAEAPGGARRPATPTGGATLARSGTGARISRAT